MDLELNFAAPDAAGGRKKAKSRGQQQQRGKSRQNGFKAAGGARTAATASSSSAQAQNGAIHRIDQAERPSELPRGDKQHSSRSPAKSAAKRQDRPARDGDGVPVASTSAAVDGASQPQPGKRQVISSLFPRPAGPRPAGADATAAGDAKKKDKKDTPAVLDPSNAPSLADDFGSMPLRPALVAHLKGKMGLAHPTTVQKLAVPFLCDPAASKKDALLQAQTGSGKTLAYLLPIIEDLLRVADECKKNGTPLDRNVGTLAIILAPTRELANQISEVATKLLSFSVEPGSASQRWITPGLLTGGAHRQHEKARLRKGVPLLIATPGRLLDHLEATKAFRIAGETIRKPKDPSRSGKASGSASDTEDEFAYEDDIAPNAGPSDKADEISSDEDFEGKGVSRSHRRNEPLSAGAASVVNPRLVLRWLVLDEADRLMDMGFEPQIESITKLLQTRLDKRTAALARAINRGTVRNRLSGQKGQRIDLDQRRTLLCSATIQENVQKLAGDTLRDPLLIKGDNESGKSSQHTSASDEKQAYAPPSQLAQHYTIVEPKLRFVTLVALLRHLLMHSGHAKTHQKILVFLSCTDSVDLHWNALAGLRMGQEEATAPKKSKNKGQNTQLGGTTQLLPGTSVYRLHGSLDLKTRLDSLKGFSATRQESAILLCTSVAARGLDVPDVSSVVQYDLPTEGGVNEYIHRVGRTARAGALGQSWVFLLPSETGWVDWAETSMQKNDAGTLSKRLQEESTEALLKLGYGGKSARDYETRATDVQMAYERWVADDTANTNLAKTAFSSHVRAYATHPSAEKHIFHVKNLHLGHLAKAFGLREAPAGIGGGVGKMPRSGAKPGKGGKRKHEEIAAESSEDDGDAPKRKTIPRSGRALEGKGLHGPHASTRRDFNIAGTDAIKAMLNRKKN